MELSNATVWKGLKDVIRTGELGVKHENSIFYSQCLWFQFCGVSDIMAFKYAYLDSG